MLGGGWCLGWYAEFLLKINLKILMRKIGARLNLKIDLVTLHTYPEFEFMINFSETLSSSFFRSRIFQRLPNISFRNSTMMQARLSKMFRYKLIKSKTLMFYRILIRQIMKLIFYLFINQLFWFIL